MGKKCIWPNASYYPEICHDGLRKAMKYVSHYSRCPGRERNWVLSDQNWETLPLEPTCSFDRFLVQACSEV
jgi:hypothetical protein